MQNSCMIKTDKPKYYKSGSFLENKEDMFWGIDAT